MDFSRLITMLQRMFLRRGINSVVRRTMAQGKKRPSGPGAANAGGAKAGNAKAGNAKTGNARTGEPKTGGTAPANPHREAARRARQAAKITRRLGR